MTWTRCRQSMLAQLPCRYIAPRCQGNEWAWPNCAEQPLQRPPIAFVTGETAPAPWRLWRKCGRGRVGEPLFSGHLVGAARSVRLSPPYPRTMSRKFLLVLLHRLLFLWPPRQDMAHLHLPAQKLPDGSLASTLIPQWDELVRVESPKKSADALASFPFGFLARFLEFGR